MVRKWEAKTSKWKAAIEKGLDVELSGNENILYLGASSGTTVEQLALRTSGVIYAVEKSYQMAIPLVRLAEKQEKILPLFCDARNTDYIQSKIGKVDILFCDIPSRDQVEILTRASELIDGDCKIFLSLKTQSISQASPLMVKRNVEKRIGEHFRIIDSKSIEPFHKKHFFFVLKKK